MAGDGHSIGHFRADGGWVPGGRRQGSAEVAATSMIRTGEACWRASDMVSRSGASARKDPLLRPEKPKRPGDREGGKLGNRPKSRPSLGAAFAKDCAPFFIPARVSRGRGVVKRQPALVPLAFWLVAVDGRLCHSTAPRPLRVDPFPPVRIVWEYELGTGTTGANANHAVHKGLPAVRRLK